MEKIKIPILWSITFFFKYRAIYDIMWKNTVQRGRAGQAIDDNIAHERRMLYN